MFFFLKNKKAEFTHLVDFGDAQKRARTKVVVSPKFTTGFTLIELLVVVAIIGVLASVVLSSLNTARTKGQDARRKADLMNIRTALELYYSNCGTYVVAQNCTGTGYGWAGGGSGWYNVDYTYSGGAGSISAGLIYNGAIKGTIIDPTGAVSGIGYMLYVGQNHYTLWASLSNPSASDTATLSSCYFSGYDNYMGPSAQNYCISN